MLTFHMVSAFCHANGVSLAQVKTAEKSNEITAIPELIKILDLEGCVVTIDAMGCQREIAEDIINAKADYVLAVKGNQKELLQGIEDTFRFQCTAGALIFYKHQKCPIAHKYNNFF